MSQDGRKVGLTEDKLLFISVFWIWKPELHTGFRELS